MDDHHLDMQQGARTQQSNWAVTQRGKQMATTRILIVDDHSVVRYGLHQLIADEPDLEICGEASGVNEAFGMVESLAPNLMVVDLSLKDGSGIELIKQIKTHYPSIKMLVWSMHDEFLFAERALKAGAMGYVCKDEPIESVLEAIHAIMRGKIHLSDRIADRLLIHMAGGDQEAGGSTLEQLSNRELEVFELIGRGCTRGQIAQNLHLSVKTIESHQENIKRKLFLSSNQELFRRAVAWVLEKKES
ncbi:response regulator transcription factor [bacterium]|nr:response regulator transcription factor [bacterium]